MFDIFNSFSLQIYIFLIFKLSDRYQEYRNKQNRPGLCSYEVCNWQGGETVNRNMTKQINTQKVIITYHERHELDSVIGNKGRHRWGLTDANQESVKRWQVGKNLKDEKEPVPKLNTATVCKFWAAHLRETRAPPLGMGTISEQNPPYLIITRVGGERMTHLSSFFPTHIHILNHAWQFSYLRVLRYPPNIGESAIRKEIH